MERLSWTCCFVKLLQAGPLAEAHVPLETAREQPAGMRASPAGRRPSRSSDLLCCQEEDISSLYFWKPWLLDTSETNLNLGKLINL